MMYVKDDGIKAIADDYQTEILPKVHDKYNSNKKQIKLDKDSKCIALFTSVGNLDDQFIKYLLVQPIEKIANRYVWVNDYLAIGRMKYSYSYECIDWSVESSKMTKGRNIYLREKRKEYLQKYSALGLAQKYLGQSVTIDSIVQSKKNMSAFIKKFESLWNKWNGIIELVIDYKLIDSVLKTKIKKAFNLEVCPYCNRQYITSFKDDNKDKVTADLDHFFPQSLFVLFGLSLYNFVPSCLVCNRGIKKDRFRDMWNPYEKGFQKIVYFRVDNAQSITSLVGKSGQIKLKMEVDASADDKLRNKAESAIKFFKFREVYESHEKYVREILYKKYAYNNTYLNQLQQIFKNNNISLQEQNMILYGQEIDEDKIDERILGKLTYDIVKG